MINQIEAKCCLFAITHLSLAWPLFTRCTLVSSTSKRVFFAFWRSRIAKGKEGSRIIIAPYLYWPLLTITITSWIRSNICSFHFLADFGWGSGPVPAATTAPPKDVVLLVAGSSSYTLSSFLTVDHIGPPAAALTSLSPRPRSECTRQIRLKSSWPVIHGVGFFAPRTPAGRWSSQSKYIVQWTIRNHRQNKW